MAGGGAGRGAERKWDKMKSSKKSVVLITVCRLRGQKDLKGATDGFGKETKKIWSTLKKVKDS